MRRAASEKITLISNMDNGDDRCVEDSCRFVVKMTFNLRPNLKGELIEFDKGWHEYLVAAQSASIGTRRKG